MRGTVHFIRSSLLTACLLSAGIAGAQTQFVRDFNLPAQPLSVSLRDVGAQGHVNVFFDAPKVEGRIAPAIRIRGTADEALTALLNTSGLKHRFLNENTVVLAVARGEKANASDDARSRIDTSTESDTANGGNESRGTSASEASVAPAEEKASAPVPEGQTSKDSEGKLDRVTEVVVTGTHIRGLTESASRVDSYSREEVERSGAGNVADFVRRLSVNFGDVAPSTINGVAGTSQSQNAVGGSGVDLRGLGSDATLVLVNGRRLAPGNYLGNFVDISAIPLAALDRVEIMPDGASALYGSDAVGGVVNFIMRQDFDGGEARARYGKVADGNHREVSLGQILGKHWANGGALLSYEYSNSTPLSAADRPYSATAVQPFDLLPKQMSHSAYLTADQSFGANTNAFVDGSFSHRSTYSDVSLANAFVQRTPAWLSSYSGTIGMRRSLPRQLELEISTTYAENDTDLKTIDLAAKALRFNSATKASAYSVDAKLDGTLLHVPQGAVLFAVGVQYRNEGFDYTESVPVSTGISTGRDIAAGFLELRIPIVGSVVDTQRSNRLELSLADRAERYSDFGSSNNPQVGLVWKPNGSLGLRGTYGRSFKAPLLNDLNQPIDLDLVIPNPDPRGGTASCDVLGLAENSCTNVIFVSGGNPRLRAQRAKTWSVGLDVHPQIVPSFQANVTYYHIKFDDRIINPGAIVPDVTNALALENRLGSQIIQRDPPQELLQSYITNKAFENPFNIDLSTVSAIVDTRVQNLSLVKTSGLDVSFSFNTHTAIGELSLGAEATYIFNFDNQITVASPAVSFLNTPYNPVDLKGRSHVSIARGALSAVLLINYTDSYKDDRSGVSEPISSWITVDSTFSYEVRNQSSLFNDLSFLLGVRNVANRKPPFVNNAVFPIDFDGANANALGRFFSLQMAKRF